MSCRWGRSAARKMILSGLLLVMIFIRHTVGLYPTDDRSRWLGGGIQQYHKVIHQHLQVDQHPLSLHHPHPHRHHHEHMHSSNREMHIKSQLHSHFYRDRDYRAEPTTTTARTFPRTSRTHTASWKWSSTTADNLRLAELTHIRDQSGDETSAGSTAFKNRLSSSERQHWSTENKQTYIESFRVKTKNNTSMDTSITKPTPNHVDRSSWSHYSHSLKQQLKEPHLQAANNHRTLLGKTPINVNFDPRKISHEDQSSQIISDNSDEYDYYNDDGKENADATIENKVENIKAHEDLTDEFNFDYMDDEPNQQNGDQNLNSLQTESLTDDKWKNYGTADAVEKSRRRYINEGQSAATAHIQRIKEDGRCRWPHPKVIPVTEASKRFVPHCTILHRCGDDTGCCDYDTKTCVARKSTTVNLNFFVIPLGGSASVEVRSFVNHTECHCVDRCLLSTCTDTGGVNIINYGGAVAATTLSGNDTCRCPTHFDVVQEEFARSRCRCDCYNNNQACNTLKRGQDGFPSEDQNCISEEKCQMPTCQYGRYSIYSGRCPKVKHQKRTISRYDYR